jgi:hypothetical protein
MHVAEVGDGTSAVGLAKLFHESCWWFLVVGKACRLTTLFEDGEDNGRLLESGCCRWQIAPPAAIVKHRVRSENQNQLWYHVKYVKICI